MKTIEFYVLENETSGDVYALADYEIKAIGKSKDDLEKELGGHGKWQKMTLKPATAKLEKEVRRKCLVGNELTGFRSDEGEYPAARFESVVESWWKDEAPSMAAFDDLPINLAERVDYAIRLHLRPNIANDPDFFPVLSAS